MNKSVNILAFALGNGQFVLLLALNEPAPEVVIFFSSRQIREFLDRNPGRFSERIIAEINQITDSNLGRLPKRSSEKARRYRGVDAEWMKSLIAEVKDLMEGRSTVFGLSHQAEYSH